MKGRLLARGLLVCCVAALVFVGSRRSPPPVRADDVGLMRRAAPHAGALTLRAVAPLDEQRALAHAHRVGNQWVADEPAGRRVEFTIVPQLQERMQKLFAEYQLPHAAVVALDPTNGRVLAYASRSQDSHRDLARDVSAPAASVFKLITSAALFDAGVGPNTRVCYGGGSSRIMPVDLEDLPRRDHACTTLEEALGKSTNAVFAKLADRNLKPATLLKYARAFGFGHDLPFGFAPPASPAEIPSSRLEFARTAAGFWHVFMSPLHAALIAATFANDGAMPEPWVVERVVSEGGETREFTRAGVSRRVLEPATARSVAHMMLRTVRDGTSRAAFLDARGRPQLPGIAVAGKTGSLSTYEPYHAYSWWVGFAPADHPRIALAALIVNEPKWRIKSSFVARELLREYLHPQPVTERELAQRKP